MKLRILACNPDGGAFYYIVRSIGNAFKALGHEFKNWDGNINKAIEYGPHIYLGSSGWRQALPNKCRNNGTKLGIHINPYGSEKLSPVPGGPDINESDKSIDWVLRSEPDFGWCYGYQDDINIYWDKWINHGISVVGTPTAGDSTIHYPVVSKGQYQGQIGFVGGYWPYKKINLDKYIVPLLNKYKVSLYGWGGWGSKSKGQIDDKDINSLYSSIKICPAISEPHTNIYGIDIPERMFKASLCGAFVITDPIKGIRRYYNEDELVVSNNPSDFLEKVEHYLKNPEKMQSYRRKMKLKTLKEHTYFSRVSSIMAAAGFIEESAEAKSKAFSDYEQAKSQAQ